MKNLLALQVPGANGQPVQIDAPVGIPSGDKFSVAFLSTTFLDLMLAAGVLLTLAYLIYGGFFWIQSRGDKQKLDKARRIITYSLIGLVLMAFSMLIVNLITRALGVQTLIGGSTP